ncbi:enoyl-CoA hydratase-related protein [Ketobacter sp.]
MSSVSINSGMPWAENWERYKTQLLASRHSRPSAARIKRSRRVGSLNCRKARSWRLSQLPGRYPKPTLAQVQGWCVGGGSDMALTADLIIAAEDAQIGTPYSRIWGSYLTGMWVYRLGLAKAKEYALTGKPLSGSEAAATELINRAVPAAELEEVSMQQARQLAEIPVSQLAAMKLVVNQAYENMGLRNTQVLGSVLDGMMRNTPEAHAFIDKAISEGVPAAVADRDAPFQDYSQRPRKQ